VLPVLCSTFDNIYVNATSPEAPEGINWVQNTDGFSKSLPHLDRKTATNSNTNARRYHGYHQRPAAATNIVVRKEYVSDLEQRVTIVERQLQRLNDILQGHFSPCVNSHNNNDHRLPPDTLQPLGPQNAVTRATETSATGLEEPRDEDASTNGMAMTFAEEHTSAYFGESSNIKFTQLLLRAIAVVHRATPAVATMMKTELNLEDGNATRFPQSQPQLIPALSGPSYPSITALPSTDAMDILLNKYFDTAGVVFPFIHEETMRNTCGVQAQRLQESSQDLAGYSEHDICHGKQY
jgi:hypothetical protein